MLERPGSQTFRFFVTRAVPAMAVALAIGLGVLALMVWSSQQSDEVSFARQARLVELVVSQLRTQIAHDQESATVWDDAVRQVRAGNSEWIDSNLGSWMHEYFGFDDVYVLDPSDKPIYAFANGNIVDTHEYGPVAREAAPLVRELRAKLKSGDTSELSDTILSTGVSDLAIVQQHPAIISLKPIVSDSGDIEQTPGKQYLHMAVRFLDGNLIRTLREDYMFEDLRFAWTPSRNPSDSNQPLKTVNGTTIGYLIWNPYRPGSAVMGNVIPVLVVVLALVLATLVFFLVMVHTRAQKLRASEARIRHLALHDALTGLPNRPNFNDRVDLALAQAEAGMVALLYLDLDRFKQVNDTLGHPAGDALIREFSWRLKAIVRHEDVVARIGGDEFTIMLNGRGGREQVEHVCQRIVDAVRKPFDIDGSTVFVGVSIGAALAPQDGLERVDLLRKADLALYFSKTTGRGRYSFYSEEMDLSLGLRQQTEVDLRAALQSGDQLSVYYQPVQSAQSNRTIGYEALLRWNHPERGWVSPELFVPVAEETGLIEALGQFALREACSATVNWPGMIISVNVSGIELSNPAYATRVATILMSTGLAPRRLELEITETTATDEHEAAAANLQALRELGVRIAIDDFGTGFSSLGRLQSLNVDRIKIDKSFVHGLGRRVDDDAIIRAIVDLAHAKGLKTTAEGVETPEQSRDLIGLGCDDLQGFLYSRPLPLQEVNRKFGVSPDIGHGKAPDAAGTKN